MNTNPPTPSGLRLLNLAVPSLGLLLLSSSLKAADQYFAGDGSALTASKWGAAGGPYTSAFTAGNVANFAVVNGTGGGAGGISVGGLNATESLYYTNSPTGTLLTGGAVVPVTVTSGKLLDLGALAVGDVTSGFTKNGLGAYATTGGVFTAGFTVNAGSVIMRGENGMGVGGSLTINGGAIAASRSLSLADKYPGGITIGGNFQLGVPSSDVPVAVEAASLTFNNSVALGAATRTITNGANGLYTLGGPITGDAGVGITINKLSLAYGVILFSGANSYSGNTTISSGSLAIGSTGALPGWDTGGRYSVAADAVLAVGNSVTDGNIATMLGTGNFAAGARLGFFTSDGNRTYAVALANTGAGSLALVKLNANKLTLSAANTYTGGTYVPSANGISSTVDVSGDQSSATGGWEIGGQGGVSNNGSDTVNWLAGSKITTIAGKTIKIGNSTRVGNGNQTLNAYGTVNNAGTLYVGRPGILNLNSGAVWSQSGDMSLNGLATYNATMTVNAGAGFTYTGASTIKLNGATNDSGVAQLTIDGTGIFTTSAGFQQGTPTTSGYGRVTLSNAGTLKLGGTVTDLIASSAQCVLATGGGIIDNNGFSAGVSTGITGVGPLVKQGVGTLTLSGVNTYTGNTTVSAGTLALSGSGSIANSPVITVASAGVLNVSAVTGGFTLGAAQTLKGSGTVSGGASINGTIAPGNSVGTLNTGNQTWAGGGSYEWEINDATGTAGSSPGWDLLNITGTLTISASPSSRFHIDLVTLANDTPGSAANFDPARPFCWEIAHASGGITGFDTNAFTLDDTGFANLHTAGKLALTTNAANTSLYLCYMPDCTGDNAIPKPAWTQVSYSPPQATVTFTSTRALAKVVMNKAINCSVQVTVYSTNAVVLRTFAITQGAEESLPVGATFVKLDATRTTGAGTTATVSASLKDGCGQQTTTDPAITTLEVLAGGKVVQRIEGLHATERYLCVRNGSPGLRSLGAMLNGRRFRVDALAAGQALCADLGAAMGEGEANVLVLTGWGEVGASALVMLSDAASGELVPVAEAGPLVLGRGAGGLVISWPEALADWRLESRGAMTGIWSEVSTPPVAHDGELRVTVAVGEGAQFYRLRAGVSARPAAAKSESKSTTTGVAVPASSSTSTQHADYEGFTF